MLMSPKSRLGAYEIVGPLGAGGMGEVYRAKDLRLGREVAIKVLPAEVASSRERLDRFEREARTVAGLNHPNIVTLFSVEDAGGVRFLTMELVEGQTLSTLVAAGGLPLPRLLDLAIPLTDALVAAHERGVIHRDLKPANVMVSREGRVKVLDFGLARMMDAAGNGLEATLAATADEPISGQGQVMGTVPYMAPEQLRGEKVDARCDLFALGVMLYELTTGKRPFTGKTPADVSSAILRDLPAPLGRVRSDLPPDLERIVSRCLEKSPRERIQSALDVNNELRSLRKGLERGGTSSRPTESVASIAVLPFANRSASADDEYFSDGLADELLNVLAKIKGLRVTARTSSFHFRGKDTTIAEIGRALDVATVLEGSVRKAGNRVRITVQLVRVSDSSHLWSESYDRTLDDIFAVQDDIAQSVLKELRTTLLGEEADSDASGKAKAEVAAAAKGRGTDPEAHRLHLLARHLIERVTRKDMEKAVELLQEALSLDPGFAAAWAELAWVYTIQAGWYWLPFREGYELARETVKRALSLVPDLPEGHARMGWIHLQYDWDFPAARASFDRALLSSPRNADALRGAAYLAWTLGDLVRSVEIYRQSLESDPLSAQAYTFLGTSLHGLGRFDESDAAYRKALEIAPKPVMTRAYMALNLLELGRREEALEEARREPEEVFRLFALAIVEHALGHAAESDRALAELIEKYHIDSGYQIAEIHAVRGDVDRAFHWLEQSYAERDPGLTELLSSPRLGPLHGDPRWNLFVRKMGLPSQTSGSASG